MHEEVTAEQWRHTSYIGAILINAHRGEKSREVTAAKLAPFAWKGQEEPPSGIPLRRATLGLLKGFLKGRPGRKARSLPTIRPSAAG